MIRTFPKHVLVQQLQIHDIPHPHFSSAQNQSLLFMFEIFLFDSTYKLIMYLRTCSTYLIHSNEVPKGAALTLCAIETKNVQCRVPHFSVQSRNKDQILINRKRECLPGSNSGPVHW